jgi:DNA-binding transcriptional LysR family regulator
MAVLPPRPKGPPLNALRAFEAAARHESFLTAAAELSVTPGAVAQQIKSLEAWAQCVLFERHANGIRLSVHGRTLLPRLSAGFDLLGLAAQDLRRLSIPSECRIATLPSIAQLWLLPLLPRLRAAFPDLTISITAMEEAPNLIRDPFDIALFFDIPAREGIAVSELTEASCSPACSPALARKLKSASDLAQVPLLHDAMWRGQWAVWLERAAVSQASGKQGAVFSLYSLAVEEAKNGAGVLMARNPLVHEALRVKALVRPFSIEIEQESRLRAATRLEQRVNTADTMLVQWLKEYCRTFN